MSRGTLAALSVAALLLLAALLPAGTAIAQQIQQVIVTNFPEIQKVEGTVSVRGPIHMTSTVAIRDIIVSPVSPKETNRLIQGGMLATDGFSHVVLSLTGAVKGDLVKPGSVGAILVPDEEPIQRAFDDRGEVQFPMEVVASSPSGGSPYFASSQPRFQVAFPRYRVLLYNTSAKTVSVSLFAYLTN